MATIYRFIVEQKVSSTGDGRKVRESTGKGAAKKGRMVSLFGGEKGGVEHNRKLRAINPLINRATGGAWEKGLRVGRAAAGLVKVNDETGKIGVSGPAIAILVAFFAQFIMKLQDKQRNRAKEMNAQNFKMLENGVGAVRGEYDISVNLWDNRATYNQNK